MGVLKSLVRATWENIDAAYVIFLNEILNTLHISLVTKTSEHKTLHS